MKKALVHICCAHCAAYTVQHFRNEGYEVYGFWYNPNIHPYAEHQSRLESTKTLAETMDFPLIIQEGYDMLEFFRRVAGHEDERCRYCFPLRLEPAARTAAERGFEGFTSTLLISPHQKHDVLQDIGAELEKTYGVAFLYADLRKRYSDSRHITKPMDLYRQQYCGCLYSELERYTEPSHHQ